jgi:hypothetical protein
VRADAPRVHQELQDQGMWWDPTWAEWTPDPGWRRPTLPCGWQNL